MTTNQTIRTRTGSILQIVALGLIFQVIVATTPTHAEGPGAAAVALTHTI